MSKLITGAALLLGACAAAEGAGTAYFYRRTMKRNHAKTERTMKMSGTDWAQYIPLIAPRKEYMLSLPHDDVWIQSEDGLKLHGVYFPEAVKSEENKLVICFHGYTSQCMSDFIGLSDYYFRNGFKMLLVDARAHGQSEGEYVGFGCKDRFDALRWIDWAIKKAGDHCSVYLHGISMGGATVLMTGGQNLPPQVKGIISDCAFTSAKDVFTHVLKTMYHLPAFPIIPLSDQVNRRLAGYGLDECNALREVRKLKVPVLLIHGDKDTFVPYRMCGEIYNECASNAQKLIIEGAAHAESYYKDMKAYEQALDSFIENTK